jgi:hypothetical protein
MTQKAPASLSTAGKALCGARSPPSTRSAQTSSRPSRTPARRPTCSRSSRRRGPISAGPYMSKGSMGQEVEHPLIGSIDKQRKARQAFLRQLKLPDDPGSETAEPAACCCTVPLGRGSWRDRLTPAPPSILSRENDYRQIEQHYRDLLDSTSPPRAGVGAGQDRPDVAVVAGVGLAAPGCDPRLGLLVVDDVLADRQERSAVDVDPGAGAVPALVLRLEVNDAYVDFRYHSAALQRLKGWGKDPTGAGSRDRLAARADRVRPLGG